MTVAAIILAAGFSTRMRAQNKLLAELRGRPLLRHTVDAVAAITHTPPLVVLGHEAGRVAEALYGAPARLATNPDYAQGQQSSVAFGLAHADPADLTLIVPGDQPALTTAHLADLIEAHLGAAEGRITIPVRAGGNGTERGMPMVLPAERVAEIRAQGRNIACRRFTLRNPHAVHRWETATPSFFEDIDTPEDLALARGLIAPERPSAGAMSGTGTHA